MSPTATVRCRSDPAQLGDLEEADPLVDLAGHHLDQRRPGARVGDVQPPAELRLGQGDQGVGVLAAVAGGGAARSFTGPARDQLGTSPLWTPGSEPTAVRSRPRCRPRSG